MQADSASILGSRYEQFGIDVLPKESLLRIGFDLWLGFFSPWNLAGIAGVKTMQEVSMAFSSSGNSAPDINVTPLIDVLLVLLIICMIITPLTPKGLGASIPNPDADQAAPAPETPVVLHIAAAGDDQ